MRAYVDADVLIWHLRGLPPARGFIAGLRASPAYDLWVGALQRAEVLFFMRPDEEEATLGLFSQFKTAPVGQENVDTAAAIYRRWTPRMERTSTMPCWQPRCAPPGGSCTA